MRWFRVSVNRSAVPSMVVLRVTGLDGKVLCGPEDVSLAESVYSTAFVIIHIF